MEEEETGVHRAPKPHSGVVVEPGLESRAHNSGSNSRPVCLPLAMAVVMVMAVVSAS